MTQRKINLAVIASTNVDTGNTDICFSLDDGLYNFVGGFIPTSEQEQTTKNELTLKIEKILSTAGTFGPYSAVS